MITMYGISNCGTIKKARNALENNGIDYHFHDYKKAGAPEDKLSVFVKALGWEKVLNRSGMTWRKLSEEEKMAVTDTKSAIAVMMEKPSIIKRPILELKNGELLLGFDEDAYSNIANKTA